MAASKNAKAAPGAAAEPDVPGALIWLRGPGGRRRPALSAEKIVETAVRIADLDGLDGLSIRRIAADLGVGATSLYWHVRNKDDLFELMFDEINSEVALPETLSGDWRAELRAVASSMQDMYARHPWAIALGIRPGLGPNVLRVSSRYTDIIRPFVPDTPRIPEIIASLNNYVVGFAGRAPARQRLEARSGLAPAELDEQLRRFVTEQLSPDDEDWAEVLRARLELHSLQTFEFGLDLMLDGIEAYLRRAGG